MGSSTTRKTTTSETTTTKTTTITTTTPSKTVVDHFDIKMRERMQKVKLKAPTPIVITDKDPFETMMEGVPDGEPGLKNDFFERIPFLPKGVGVTSKTPSRIASISESDLPSSHVMDFIPEPNIIKSLSSIRMKLNDLRESTDMSNEISIAKNTEDDIQRLLDNQQFESHVSEAMKTEMDIQKSHMNAPMDNRIPQAHKIESAIKSDHEQRNFDAIIPNVKDVGN